ncbi:toprim domain-containing protein [Lentibacillus sp. N15]|uniref:DNA primase n=1 Tax=Lentibacillus songyuanensis TaxID=3136161 RepID=UPI0031BA08C1
MKHTAHDWLERYYHYVLLYTKLGCEAKQYLFDRGINEEMMKKFKLGFAPGDVKPTLGFLKAKGFEFNDLVRDKVLSRFKNGKLTDPFKNRIIFPIQNYAGQTVAFGGRTLNSSKIKYINTPETDYFIKGDNVYGFHLAKEETERQGYAIVFEGYFDAITAHQYGIQNTLATLGTALTTKQALLIKSITPNVVIAFDGDDAGVESSFKSASVLNQVGCNVKIAHLINQLDPDDYIKRQGHQNFMREIALAKPITESFIDFKRKGHDLTCPTGRYAYAYDVLKEFSTDNPKELKQVLKSLGMTLNIPLKIVDENFVKEG